MKNMMRLAPAGATALATFAAVAVAPTADAAVIGSCRLVVPSTVRITSSYQHITPTVTGGCSYYASSLFAVWSGYTSQGAEDSLYFDRSGSQHWDVYDWHSLGRVTWRPEGADESINYNEFTQNSPTTDVRLGSWSTIKATRSGTSVTLSSNGARWSSYWGKPIAFETSASFQYKDVGSSTWRTLVTKSVKGSASYSYRTSATRDYRVVYSTTATTWGVTSNTARK